MKNKRTEWTSCRVTHSEKEHIANKAKYAGVSPAEYISLCSLPDEMVSSSDDCFNCCFSDITNNSIIF